MYQPQQKAKNLALFDFDGTLCRTDSFTQFIFHTLPKRRILRQGVKILPWICAYYLKCYPAHAMRPKLFQGMFQRMPVASLAEKTPAYVDILLTQLHPQLLAQLQQHQALGDEVVLVSASLDIYLTPICQALNVALLCSETEIQQQHYTGNYQSADCSGQQKRQRILAQYDLSQYRHIYAYGNSHEDLAMLSLAHYAYMCGVDQHLPPLPTH